MIRPSALNGPCGYAPALAEKYPETSDVAEVGKGWHHEIAMAVTGQDLAVSDEAKAAIDWLTANGFDKMQLTVETRVQVIDPETLQVITEGTPDLVAGPDTGGVMSIIDWKKPGQMWAGLVASPDDNLQLIAYGLSTKLPFRCAIVPLDKSDDRAQWSRVFTLEDHWALLDRVKRAASREPIPQVGQHCGDCYQRLYCHAYQARLRTALAAIPAKGDEVLDDARASDLSMMIDAAEDWVKAAKQVRSDYVRAGGQVVVNGKRMELQQRAGRETADADAIRKAGLTQYLKVGKPFETPVWKKV